MRSAYQPSGRWSTARESSPFETVARLGSNPARSPQHENWRPQAAESWEPSNSSSNVYGAAGDVSGGAVALTANVDPAVPAARGDAGGPAGAWPATAMTSATAARVTAEISARTRRPAPPNVTPRGGSDPRSGALFGTEPLPRSMVDGSYGPGPHHRSIPCQVSVSAGAMAGLGPNRPASSRRRASSNRAPRTTSRRHPG